MMSFQNRIIERTLYDPLSDFLREIKFDSIGESRAGMEKDFSDIVFTYGKDKFVIEVKLEKDTPTLSTKAIAQAFRYASKLDTSNVLVLIYPETLKNQPITNSEWLRKVTLHDKIKCHVFTDYWNETVEDSASKIFEELKNKIDSQVHKIDLHTIVKQIRQIVSDLNAITSHVKKEKLVSEVVEKLDLFTSIGDIDDQELAENQITNLSSYLLFNQLLFYRIYSKKMTSTKLPELTEISKIQDLQKYFDAITKIDFKSIYKINILGQIPEDNIVIEILNDVIQAIQLIRAELITHDLAGRFFHDLIPHEIRKILAAFYTHPNSADLLAGLTIHSWNETVMDPACGSGTLLVASYSRKLNLYKSQKGFENFKTIHKQFIEKEITGADLMPFASHLTTVNLAMQQIDQPTNIVRIASMDSLELANRLRSTAFTRGKGIPITGYEKSAQMTLTNEIAWSKKGGSVSMEGRGSTFSISPLDTVIMNPPFSDREKMPEEMRTKLNNNVVLKEKVGGMVNLWGYFIGLSNLLLKNGGMLGAVIPISIARGGATQSVRDFLLSNFSAKFIVKPIIDDAFSENSAYRDVLYIAEKKRPDEKDYTAIVSIKSEIKKMSSDQVTKLINDLNRNYIEKTNKNNDDYEITFVKTKELFDYSDNLMPLIGFKSQKNGLAISNFMAEVRRTAGNKLVKLSKEIMREGLHASPEGLSELVFINNPIDESRVKRSFLILNEKKSQTLKFKIKSLDNEFEIPISKTQPALRTLTGIKNFLVDNIDYVITEEPAKFDEILRFSKWKGKFDWFTHNKNVMNKLRHVIIPNRFRPDSSNTHHFAFYSRKKFVAPHSFKILDFNSSQEGLFQTLLLNSSITIANFLLYRSQSTRGFTHIMEADWVLYDLFDIKKLSSEEKSKLEEIAKKLQEVDFPSIKDQYFTNNKYRRGLDNTILQVLGFDKDRIEPVLDKLYKAIYEELSVD